MINGRDDSINVNSLNHLVSLCVKSGFPLNSLSTRSGKTATDGSTHSSVDGYEPSHREFLLTIPDKNWATIIDWGRSHYLISDDMLAKFAKLNQGAPLSDTEIDSLWELRERMIRRGFPKSVFTPHP